jgi:hypothetical protein
MTNYLEIFRVYKPNCTIGSGYVYSNDKIVFKFKTLELPWLNNARSISCIPEGQYIAIKHPSPKFKQSFWLQDVPGRSEILCHAGNFTREIRGCILPGKRHIDIDGDGIMDVTESKATITELYNHLPNKFVVIIK